MPVGYDVQVIMEQSISEVTLRSKKRALDLSQLELLRNLKINSPVDQGKMQGSWFKLPNPSADKRRIKSAANYTANVNDGTGIYGPRGRIIRPRTGRLLGPFKYQGKLIAVPWIRGQKGQKFVEKSITQTKTRTDEFIIRAVMETEGSI